MPAFTTRVNFNNTNRDMNGRHRVGGVPADAAGDFSGTTALGGANGDGTVFDIPSIDGNYAGMPATFDGTNGAYPDAGLTSDGAGDLVGTAVGAFTIMDTDTAAATATDDTTTVAATAVPSLNTLVNFNYYDGEFPYAGLLADAAGDLFGTAEFGGAYGYGTVFEIAKTGGGYASTPTTLVSFNKTDGANPTAGLIADAAGDLFGTTGGGGAYGYGTVFELVNNGGGSYTPATLASFNGTNGASPDSGLIADPAGDIFGTTYQVGPNNDGTVFEIAKTGSGYASTPTTLVSFNGSNGYQPVGGLIADAAGDLFGTTILGGAYTAYSPDGLGFGTVFEIAKSGSGYASTPTTLVSFDGTNGELPGGSLIADAAGDLLGTTPAGGAIGYGTSRA